MVGTREPSITDGIGMYVHTYVRTAIYVVCMRAKPVRSVFIFRKMKKAYRECGEEFDQMSEEMSGRPWEPAQWTLEYTPKESRRGRYLLELVLKRFPR